MPHLLALTHQLEAVSSGSTIGPLAETLLEEFLQGGSPPVGDSIRGLRAATKAAMREKAMARRRAMLTALNMPQQPDTNAPTTDALSQAVSTSASEASAAATAAAAPATAQGQGQEAQDVVEEERRGLVCMVCKEGYASQPKQLLGAYCYCMKLQPGEALGAVPELWKGPRTSAKSSNPQVRTLLFWFCRMHRAWSSTCQLCAEGDSCLMKNLCPAA